MVGSSVRSVLDLTVEAVGLLQIYYNCVEEEKREEEREEEGEYNPAPIVKDT